MSDGAPGLTRIPIAVSAAWITTVVSTQPPLYPNHEEKSLVVRIVADEPVLIARIVDDGQRLFFARDRVAAAGQEIDQRLSFFPSSWDSSDDVQINFAGIRVGVTSAELKRDPAAYVAVSSFDGATTVSLIEVAALKQPRPIRISIFPVLRRDVEVTRSRWRLASGHEDDVPEGLGFLFTGRQSGDCMLPA
jgi:hypothetical protein